MLRLIITAAIAYFLIPVEFRPDFSGAETQTVTSGEALDAAGSVIRDLGSFCERNPDACDTGKTLLKNAKETVTSGIEKLAEEAETAPDAKQVEQITEIEKKSSDTVR